MGAAAGLGLDRGKGEALVADGGRGALCRAGVGDGASGGRTGKRLLGLYYYRDDHGAATVVVADPLADDATG